MVLKKKIRKYKPIYYHYIRGSSYIEVEIINEKNKGVVIKSNTDDWPLGYSSTWSLSAMKKGRLKEQNN